MEKPPQIGAIVRLKIMNYQFEPRVKQGDIFIIKDFTAHNVMLFGYRLKFNQWAITRTFNEEFEPAYRLQRLFYNEETT
jgi:hypothetical protein